MKKVMKFVVGVVGGLVGLFFVLVVIAMVTGAGNQRSGQAVSAAPGQAPAERPVVDVTASQLHQECDENEVAFEARYDGVRVRITGNVSNVNSGISGASLSLGPMLRGAQATDLPKEALMQIKKGQTVTVLCERVSEVIGQVVASDCQLLEATAQR